ncbi:ATP synthase subunit H-domain-containing protein [Zopfochytrium polystomum]|nr:ATP synthase subunit H-domain-containing protein [Zopfochytrium polystomum]
MGLLTIFISLIVFAAIGVGAFYLVPKGPDQILYRSSITLTIVCTWMMWAVTYLAQVNPLIRPERNWVSHSGGGGSGGH